MYFLGKERPVGFGAAGDDGAGGCGSFGGRLFLDPVTGRLACVRFDGLPVFVQGAQGQEERPIPPDVLSRVLELKRIEDQAFAICDEAKGQIESVRPGVRVCRMPDGSACAPEALVKGTCKEPQKSSVAQGVGEPLDRTTLIVGGVILAAGLAVALWPRPRGMRENGRRRRSRKGN